MTPLRQRVIEEMRLRNFSRHTESQYLIRIRQFAEHFQRSPEQLGPREVREFQVHLLDKVSSDVEGQYATALRFLYGQVLHRKWVIERMPRRRTPKRLPAVISSQEVLRMIGKVRNIKHRAILATAYAGGLRAAEVTHLKLEDIDSERMVIRVEQGSRPSSLRHIMSASAFARLSSSRSEANARSCVGLALICARLEVRRSYAWPRFEHRRRVPRIRNASSSMKSPQLRDKGASPAKQSP